MADEITVSASLRFEMDGRKDALSFSGVKVDMTGGDFVHKTQTVTTSEATLKKGDITTPGYIVVKNYDTMMSVDFYMDSAGDGSARVGPGEVALFRFSTGAGSQPYVRASGGASTAAIEYVLLED